MYDNVATTIDGPRQVRPRGHCPRDLSYDYVDSPVGRLLVAGTDKALHYLSFATGHKAFGPRPEWSRDARPFARVRQQLDAYFAGTLTRFDLPLALNGTPFQNRAWAALAAIPFGETRCYSEMAAQIGHPDASRAVGAANGNNPLPIILPCHRVIGKSGALTGFGGGLDVKRFLLCHEGALTAT